MWTRGFVWDWVETGEWDPGHMNLMQALSYVLGWAGVLTMGLKPS